MENLEAIFIGFSEDGNTVETCLLPQILTSLHLPFNQTSIFNALTQLSSSSSSSSSSTKELKTAKSTKKSKLSLSSSSSSLVMPMKFLSLIDFQNFVKIHSLKDFTRKNVDSNASTEFQNLFNLFSGGEEYITLKHLNNVTRELGDDTLSPSDLMEMIDQASGSSGRVSLQSFISILRGTIP